MIVDFDAIWGLLYHVPVTELPGISTSQWLYDNFIVRGGFTTILAQCYPLKSRYHDPIDPNLNFSLIPNTLPTTSCGSNPCGILAKDVSPGVYDTWLQTDFNYYPLFVEDGSYPDGELNQKHPCFPGEEYYEGPKVYGNMRYTLQTCSEISRIGNIPFIFMPQAHHWYYPWEINREPTNEELEVMANLAVSYGARGLMW